MLIVCHSANIMEILWYYSKVRWILEVTKVAVRILPRPKIIVISGMPFCQYNKNTMILLTVSWILYISYHYIRIYYKCMVFINTPFKAIELGNRHIHPWCSMITICTEYLNIAVLTFVLSCWLCAKVANTPMWISWQHLWFHSVLNWFLKLNWIST